MQSPADAAAAHRAPPASLITVAVEQRALTATVTARGTVAYGAPQPITLTGAVAGDNGEPAASPLVTKAPVAGRTLHEGEVLLEVSGRPVIVLKGKVPMYRTLTRGSTGDDVRQLRAALHRLMPGGGLSPGGPLNDSALHAVGKWYEHIGYRASGPTIAQRAQQRQLQQAVKTAQGAAGTGGKAAGSGSGGQAIADARAELAEFDRTYGISIASGEVIFLPNLPVRLTAVAVKAGAPASGELGTVADPTLVVNGDVATDDADLLKVGMAATLEHPNGNTFPATLSRLGGTVPTAPAPDGAGKAGAGKAGAADASQPEAAAITGTPIRLTLRDPKKLEPFAGQAFKITIKVGATGHAVLAVPVAAVFTAADGQARVSVPDPAGTVRDVAVDAGLTTGGYVQVTPTAADSLHVGDRVVVGNQ
jgi:hypothetical protein